MIRFLLIVNYLFEGPTFMSVMMLFPPQINLCLWIIAVPCTEIEACGRSRRNVSDWICPSLLIIIIVIIISCLCDSSSHLYSYFFFITQKKIEPFRYASEDSWEKLFFFFLIFKIIKVEMIYQELMKRKGVFGVCFFYVTKKKLLNF